MSRCHISHELPWANAEAACFFPRELLRLQLSYPTPPRSWGWEQRKSGVPPPPSYIAAVQAYNDATRPARKRAQHFVRRFCATISAFSRTERAKYTDEEVMGVREVLTEKDRQEWPDLFAFPGMFEEWNDMGGWCENEQSGEIEPLEDEDEQQEQEEEEQDDGEEDDQEEEEAGPAHQAPHIPVILREPVPVYRLDHVLCDLVDVLKWLLFNDRLLPLLALVRRCPSLFDHYQWRLLTNRYQTQCTISGFDELLVHLYLHLNLAIALGETAGRGPVTRDGQPQPSYCADSPYHSDLTSFLHYLTPESCSAGHEAALNELLRPHLVRREGPKEEMGKRSTGLREWDFDLSRCEALCKAVWKVMVHMDVLVREIETRRAELRRERAREDDGEGEEEKGEADQTGGEAESVMGIRWDDLIMQTLRMGECSWDWSYDDVRIDV